MHVLYVGGSGPGNYSTIGEAVNDAKDGDTIFVYNDSSPYFENIVIDRALCLLGEDTASTMIHGNGAEDVLIVHADNVTIQGFTIVSWKRRQSGCDPLVDPSFSDLVVGLEIAGIFLSGCKNARVTKNIISWNYNGVFLQDCRNASVVGNRLSSNENCIVAENSVYITIVGNAIGGGRIHRGVYLGSSSFCEVSENSIGFTTHYAIGLGASEENVIWGNTLADNGLHGMYVFSSYENLIVHNNFVRNGQHAWDNGDNLWDSGYPGGGNYWANYTGGDLDGDGLGDTPYNISAGDNQDRYPLMYPWSGVLGDLDGDGDVDLCDLAQFLSHYGTVSNATYWMGDLDGDGNVDLSDLAQLLAGYETAKN